MLALLALNQALVAWQIHETLEQGTPAMATVTELEVSNRVDVTYDYVSLRVDLPDGSVIEHEEMSLPHTLAVRLEGQTTMAVMVLPGASQEIVVTEIASTHWRIAAINAAVCFVGMLMALFGVVAWQRYLRKHGDPSDRAVGAVS